MGATRISRLHAPRACAALDRGVQIMHVTRNVVGVHTWQPNFYQISTFFGRMQLGGDQPCVCADSLSKQCVLPRKIYFWKW